MTQAHAPSPEKVIEHTLIAHATAAVVATAATHSLFTLIEEGADTPEALAGRAGLSPRGTLAVLDALVGIGLIRVVDGRYRNSEEASFYLVENQPAYLGAHARMVLGPYGRAFQQLPEVVRTGVPSFLQEAGVEDHLFWEELVLTIAPLGMPVAKTLATQLDLRHLAAPAVLDVAGGAGMYSIALLRANAGARATQIDRPNVNRIARDVAARFGVLDRFRTVDGDFHTADFGASEYDVALYANIARQESPEDNTAVFRKVRRALRPGGTLVVSDYVLNDDRTGNAWSGLLHIFMLVRTKAGAAWRRADYQGWLRQAGFQNVTFEPTATPATLIYAR
jgi:ubiquinone/menaquinone biosynthesis C-methylase UbiE